MADYISREVAIERFCNVYCGCSPEECGFKIQQDGAEECAAVRALKETPAADVRPVVRGEWVHEEPNGANNFKGCYWCDQCHQPIAHKKNICPNCGAYMRNVKTNEK